MIYIGCRHLIRGKLFYELTTTTFKPFLMLPLCVLLTETGLKKCIALTKTRADLITSGFPSLSWPSPSHKSAVICAQKIKHVYAF
uniref:AlNc14C372G11115 protein n=1 Tax=Albugo laibachii Nc14 TaxID=890382 RepID=F0WY55_9STRA|nr:AlNc14C372G11115 [Albugo laibachii Nc14]|eukprot:CCA26406.1 AlNc14C372G11115 [Albugo laibachii Nc14]